MIVSGAIIARTGERQETLLLSVSLCRAEPAVAAGVRRGYTSPCVK